MCVCVKDESSKDTWWQLHFLIAPCAPPPSKSVAGTSDVDKNLPSCYMLVGSDILKSIVAITGACSECKNQKLKHMTEKRGLSFIVFRV